MIIAWRNESLQEFLYYYHDTGYYIDSHVIFKCLTPVCYTLLNSCLTYHSLLVIQQTTPYRFIVHYNLFIIGFDTICHIQEE
jgi:hypothetical protein